MGNLSNLFKFVPKIFSTGRLFFCLILSQSIVLAAPSQEGFFSGFSQAHLEFMSQPGIDQLRSIPPKERDFLLGNLFAAQAIEASALKRSASAQWLHQILSSLNSRIAIQNFDRFAAGGLSEFLQNPDAESISYQQGQVIYRYFLGLVGGLNSQATHRLFCSALEDSGWIQSAEAAQSMSEFQKKMIDGIVIEYGSLLGGDCPVNRREGRRLKDIRGFLNSIRPGLSIYLNPQIHSMGISGQISQYPSAKPTGSLVPQPVEVCTEFRFRCGLQKQFEALARRKSSQLSFISLSWLNCPIAGRLEKDSQGRFLFSKEYSKYIEGPDDLMRFQTLDQWIALLKVKGLIKENPISGGNSLSCPEISRPKALPVRTDSGALHSPSSGSLGGDVETDSED